ncbi:MAG: DUF4282 domain-containing protein [Holophagales bacterium]|nr:DUF4282 domain-containing protein [Holophagales bacterium]
MPEEKFFVAVDGRQLDGEQDMGQVRQICSQYAGRQVMVWNEALGSWTDPKTLPSFRVADIPAPAPAPAPARTAAPDPTPEPAPAPRVMHPAAERASAAGAAAQGIMTEDAGALKGLLDLKFERLIAPRLVRLLYVVILILCGLAALGGILSGLKTMFEGIRFGVFFVVVTGFVMMVVGPLFAALYLALMRVLLEGVLVLFQIREKLPKS